MLSKMVLSVIVLGLCSHGCLAQIRKPSSIIVQPRPSPPDISPCLFPAADKQTPLTLFPVWTTPPQAWDPLNTNWGQTELAAKLAGIKRGMPLKIAVQRLRLLGGVEDGGLQSIPITRYFFKPGYIVTIPQKDGFVSGPLQVTLGQMACD